VLVRAAWVYVGAELFIRTARPSTNVRLLIEEWLQWAARADVADVNAVNSFTLTCVVALLLLAGSLTWASRGRRPRVSEVLAAVVVAFGLLWVAVNSLAPVVALIVALLVRAGVRVWVRRKTGAFAPTYRGRATTVDAGEAAAQGAGVA
jgi:hypothetical protein